MRHAIRTMICAGVAAASLSVAPVAHSNEGGTTEGCTPGYWKVKQHHDSWQEAAPSQKLTSKFVNASMYRSIKNMTLLQALNAKGGTGLEGAAQILARAAVAAYLNAAYDDGAGHLAFPWRRMTESFGNPALIAAVNDAFASRDRATMLDLATRLDQANNLGCPLS